MRRIKIIRLVFLSAMLVTIGHAVDPIHPVQEVVRLKIPIKVIKPNAGPGGINIEVVRWGFIDQTGNVVIPAEWDSVADFHEGLVRVKKGDKVGFIDQSGKIIIDPQWDPGLLDIWGNFMDQSEGNFSEGLAPVQKNKKWGYIDRTGKLVLPLQWAYADEFKDGLAPVARYCNKYQVVWGFIDTSGKVVIEPQWARINAFHEGLACVEEHADFGQGKKGYIDTKGKVVIKPQWDQAWDFVNGVARVAIGDYSNQKFGQIDTSGKVTFTLAATAPTNEFNSHGLTPMKLETSDKWGFADRTGKMVVSPQWVEIKPFSCGLAAVVKDLDHTGFVDESGKVVVEPIWDGAYAFENGICWVQKHTEHGTKYGVIDPTGKVLIPPEWDNIEIKNGYCFARRVMNPAFGESYAWFDKTGKMIWQSEDSK